MGRRGCFGVWEMHTAAGLGALGAHVCQNPPNCALRPVHLQRGDHAFTSRSRRGSCFLFLARCQVKEETQKKCTVERVWTSSPHSAGQCSQAMELTLQPLPYSGTPATRLPRTWTGVGGGRKLSLWPRAHVRKAGVSSSQARGFGCRDLPGSSDRSCE